MTRAKLGKPHTEPSLPLGVRKVHARFGDDWTVRVTCGEGTTTAQERGAPRGDGTRPTITVDVPCHSIALRGTHPDHRQVRAVWLRRLDEGPGGKPRAWKFEQAWRGRHEHEHGPVQLGADALAAYVADPAVELAPVVDLFTAHEDEERAA